MYTVNNSEQLRELSCNDLSFLENDQANIGAENGNVGANSTVRDLDNILDKFQADAQILLDNPNQLLNCKYNNTTIRNLNPLSFPLAQVRYDDLVFLPIFTFTFYTFYN